MSTETERDRAEFEKAANAVGLGVAKYGRTGEKRYADPTTERAYLIWQAAKASEAGSGNAVAILRRVKKGLQSARLESPGSLQSLTTTLSMIESELDDYFEGTSHCALAESSAQQAEAEPVGPYLTPIARRGEQQFACILRNRSGIDAGEIDFGARFIDDLSEGDQQKAVEAAYSVYLKWCDETGKKSRRDTSPPTPAPVVPGMKQASKHSDPRDQWYAMGWNDCRAELLSAAPQPENKEGEP